MKIFVLGAEAKFVLWENDLRLWVYRLLNYPADLAALLPTFVETMRMGVTQFGDEFNRVAVSAIYQTCLYEWSFCHIGSKLCNVISNSIKKLDGQIGFRSILLQTLQKDYYKKEHYVKSVDPMDRKVSSNIIENIIRYVFKLTQKIVIMVA